MSTADYTCYRTRSPLSISASLEEPAWRKAPRSPRFADMASGEPGFFDTRAAALWDDTNLYIAFWIDEPFVEAHLTERDSLIFLENDVEVFIDGGDAYYEFEINALGTIYEVFFIWQDAYRRGGRFDVPEFDLLAGPALSFAGNEDRTDSTFWRGTHPRGARWAFRDWDLPGLRSAVQIDGRLNDRTVVDAGWKVELAFPWAGMKHLANGRSLPPGEGDVWTLFLGRFEKLMSAGREVMPHPAWCWTPHGIPDTHQPDKWTKFRFTEAFVEDL